MGRKSNRIAARERIAAKENVRDEKSRRPRRREQAGNYEVGDAALFAATLFLSAALLFTVQPMFAKMALPRLGGAPAVWNACLVFYQAVLLGGYLYAHLSLKWLGARRQAVLHLGLLALAWVSLPIHIAKSWQPPATTFPAPWLWMLLTVALGLPFLVVSASAPMLQAWFARTGRQKTQARDPYFLYTASNLGSLLGLIGYPLVMEARLTLDQQSLAWAIGFGLLMALVAACAVKLWRAESRSKPDAQASGKGLLSHVPRASLPVAEGERRITARRRLRWLALALVPSSLMMGVTSYITSEITQLPTLWVIPLSLYLLTFVFVFAPRVVLPLKWMLLVQPPLIVLAAVSLMFNVGGLREMLLLGSVHLVAFFVTAMVCHGQLAADRPEPERLTEFYLWMSLGGVLGGLFSALVAPLIFKQALEYPLMMAAACMLRPRVFISLREMLGMQSISRSEMSTLWFSRRDLLPAIAMLVCLGVAWGLRADAFLWSKYFGDGLPMRLAVVLLAAVAALLLARRPIAFGAAVAALAAIGLWSAEAGVELLSTERSFFGVLRVEYDTLLNGHRLLNGTTTHGAQSLYEDQRREPLGYYHRKGPLGEIFSALRPRRPLAEVGVLGLGAGTIAAYAEPGERFTFYEIDPAVEKIARNPKYFTYLADCRGTTETVLGDARLSLEHGPPRLFDLLILDVFSSDAVPVHLATREAIEVYRGRLAPHGVMAFHISSRYFDLEPVLGRLAASAGLTARIWRDRSPDESKGIDWFASVWVAMAEDAKDLGDLARIAHWTPPACDPGPVWTDDFSNVMATMHWHATDFQLIPLHWKTAGRAQRAAAHGWLAAEFIQELRMDDAMDQFQRTLALDPNSATNQYAYACLLASRGRFEEAVDHYAEALIREPGHAAWHDDCGVALAKLGKEDDAIDAFHRAIQLDPQCVDAFNNLAKMQLDRKQFADALDSYSQGITARPENAEIRYHYGQALERLAKIPEALGELRTALSLARQQKDAELSAKIEDEIKRCEAWPWEGKK